nr:carcinine hydrolase/isopenicillin-N N-acyltransferase family protein [Nitratireductor aquibiodomus]
MAQLSTNAKGLPVAFAMRAALARPTMGDAASFLASADHASGQTYQLGDRTGVTTLECSANSVATVPLISRRSPHTNHPLANNDARDAQVSLSGSVNSRARLESLRVDLDPDRFPRIGVDDLKTALSACRAGGEVSIEATAASAMTEPTTFGAAIFEIGETVRASICAGPPSSGTWRTFKLRSP